MLVTKSYCYLLFVKADTDKDFEPSADMMVHDFDDEHTLEQEENQSNSDGGNELADLEKVQKNIFVLNHDQVLYENHAFRPMH